jgi:truncated hemoglobin YjbI
VLHFFDDDRLPSLKDAQRRWFRSVLGGAPADDRPDLAAAHAHLVITDEQVAVVLGHLDGAMSDAGVGDDLRRQVLSLVGRLWLARVF